MRVIRDKKKSFDLDEFLMKPLFAHLATSSEKGAKESPVWFHWENNCIWILGNNETDSFPSRIQKFPSCAIGIVDFNHMSGKVLHAGFRGVATVEPFDINMAKRLLSRYLGTVEERWDNRFKRFNHNSLLICFQPATVVVRDQSFRVNS
ncbi:pyridoxamine 5'-phosphate oxidase family protein [Peribacillus frigoritolerans]|uniref:pyridoxamine 5'-phosphate oxidase family protein n=1 Tax=Peribacillus frigoritolerans TaxID=450367 RepID=UPI00105A9B12|nr:pyridoxamine 5'-phosphate oxidase family protein [Peribacillus frigoritolerans]TDL82420.1 pyridoxamine 5'-phosphate oxidase family protein [Peribacillus frigoritolerans]